MLGDKQSPSKSTTTKVADLAAQMINSTPLEHQIQSNIAPRNIAAQQMLTGDQGYHLPSELQRNDTTFKDVEFGLETDFDNLTIQKNQQQ